MKLPSEDGCKDVHMIDLGLLSMHELAFSHDIL